ncbi:MAG: RNA polymerase sigma factor [Alphaproteobacteria bacterium]
MVRTLSDLELAQQAAAGDRGAIELLLARHYDLIYRIAVKWAGNQTDGQDIAQNACLKLVTVLPKYEGRARFTTWLYRVVINVAHDWHRKETRHQHMAEIDDALLPPNMSDTPEARAEARQILGAVQTLPKPEKDALMLVVSEGMSHAEAAAICKVKEGTISWRIHEARKKLKALANDGVPA